MAKTAKRARSERHKHRNVVASITESSLESIEYTVLTLSTQQAFWIIVATFTRRSNLDATSIHHAERAGIGRL